ncbi:hypothetical protein [Sandaracinus amylolyticus]|uniref:hypothetical protein n=1 Tax=Sandaracinus amylolyticus TaxID=927083 RepID=UPI001F412238|nr:hypothetical protein [Sandaracinus amylolyticus]
MTTDTIRNTLAMLALVTTGCSSSAPEVSLAELCGSPDAFADRDIAIDVTIDPSALTLWESTLVACSESSPCCNAGTYLFELPCASDVPIVIVPAGLASDTDPGRLACRGGAPGVLPAECEPTTCGTAEVRAIERIEGRIRRGIVTAPFGEQVRELVVHAYSWGPIADAGPLPDAAP